MGEIATPLGRDVGVVIVFVAYETTSMAGFILSLQSLVSKYLDALLCYIQICIFK